MDTEQIKEAGQEACGLSEMEKESREMEEADARAVAQAREKKLLRRKKARRRKLMTVIVFLLIVSLGVFFYRVKKEREEAAANSAVEILAEGEQCIVYAKIDQIQGNEIQYHEVEMKTESEPETDYPQAGKEQPEAGMGQPAGAERNMTGQTSYVETDRGGTKEIPVGTDVTTALGAVTTFSRLRAEDIIAMVLEGDEIVRIYIVG